MIKSEQVGRRLVLSIETAPDEDPIEPFVIPPVSVKVGRMLTGYFLNTSAGNMTLTPEQQEAMFVVSLDGGTFDEETQEILPRVDADGVNITPNYTRSGDTLTASEQEELFWKAFMWQSVLGHEGIAVYDADGGGTAGMLKTVRLLAVRSNPQLLKAADQMQQAGTPTKPSNTDSSGAVPSAKHKLPAPPTTDKLPKSKRSKGQNVS